MSQFKAITNIKLKSEKIEEKIKLKHDSISMLVSRFSGKQGDYWVSIIPSLNISGYGKTEEDSNEDLNYNVKVFCHDMFAADENSRIQELKKLGWVRGGLLKKQYSKSFIDSDGVLQNFDHPEDVKVSMLQTA
ncbi:hypothetical protein [Aquirufa nivalisilvae]|uniref:hypothetical protein n=1 Tax=Aquirufa nivalisilvae TaxID=2516557 RepID=UPI0022A8F95B|nr:hypothetical protein [Aquirufa nivalisilvae]MCZ2480056.1 hypothetical protein [Aquirufa nivalisilvae]